MTVRDEALDGARGREGAEAQPDQGGQMGLWAGSSVPT
jgi:hypothetical protein